MAKPSPSDLTELLSLNQKEDYRVKEHKQLHQKMKALDTRELVQRAAGNWINCKDEILRNGVYSALLGALYAFYDRGLDPQKKEHFYLFSEISDDIENVYKSIRDQIPDEETWLFETFDYGIKHVYYLDWKLYLSQICY